MRITRRSVLQALTAQAFGAGTAFGQTKLLGKPKPLPKDAVTHDWATFLGPSHNGVSTETRLSRTLPPPLVWEFGKGTGYASPAIAGDHLVFLHRRANDEVVECLHPETGSSRWQFRYATSFEDRYGYNNGPRSSPEGCTGLRVQTLNDLFVGHTMDAHQAPARDGRRRVSGAFREFPDEGRRQRAAQPGLGGDAIMRRTQKRGPVVRDGAAR